MAVHSTERTFVASTTENQLEIEPHVPGFVQQVSEACGLACGPYKLSTTPWLVDSDYEADRLIEMLLNPHRRLPVFVLTVPENADNSETPLLNADELTRATLGMAHVVIVPPKYTWAISNRFGRLRSVFGGAVRAYLAGFTEDADPYGHRLILGDNIASPEGQMQCMRWMRSLAASESIRSARLGQDVLAFADIKNASLRLKQQRLEQEGASDSEQLEAAKAHIKALEKQIEEEKSLQQAFSDEHAKAEERAVAAERQMSASAFRIQQLIEQLIQRGETPDTNIDLPTTWSEFTEWCDTNLAGRVVLAPVARRGVKSAEFEDVRLVARCLIWLANDCRNWRMEGGKGTIREESVEEGIRNAHCGTDEFDLDWQGQRYTADWHIKNGGNTRDPKRCLKNLLLLGLCYPTNCSSRHAFDIGGPERVDVEISCSSFMCRIPTLLMPF